MAMRYVFRSPQLPSWPKRPATLHFELLMRYFQNMDSRTTRDTAHRYTWPRSNGWVPRRSIGSASSLFEISAAITSRGRAIRSRKQSPNIFPNKANYSHVPDAGTSAASHPGRFPNGCVANRRSPPIHPPAARVPRHLHLRDRTFPNDIPVGGYLELELLLRMASGLRELLG